MNKGIWILSLLLSFSTFAQLKDTGKYELINKICGSIEGNKNSYSDPVQIESKDGKKCWRVECRAQTKNENGDLNITSNYKQRCFSESQIASILWNSGNTNTSVNVDDLTNLGIEVNTGNNGTLSAEMILKLCKEGKCPKGYKLVNGKVVVIGNGSDDIQDTGSNTTITRDGRCPKVGCWYNQQEVTFSALLSRCFKAVNYDSSLAGRIFARKSRRGKLKKLKVKKECAGAYEANIDASSGQITITGSGKGHVGTRVETKYVYVDKPQVQVTKPQTQQVQVVTDSRDDGSLIFVDDNKGPGVQINARGGWVFKNGQKCTYIKSWDECLDSQYDRIVSQGGDYLHCINCQDKQRRNQQSDGGWGAYGRSAGGILNGIGNIVGGIAPGLFGWLSSKEYAGAAKYGFEQCRGMQNDYQTNAYNYITQNELPDREITVPGCNGYGMGGFVGGYGLHGNGLGGFGNPWLGAGYTNGFLGGLAGPYGQFNPYGNVNGWGNNGFGNGFGGGINIGIGGGLGNNGFGNNNWLGGTPGWTGTPGFNPNGPATSWGPGGWNGGGGFGLNGGWGLNGQNNGIVPWQNGGQGIWHGQNPNGWGQGGQNWGAIQQSYGQNQQAQGIGAFYQQQALGQNFQNAGQQYYQYGANGYNGYSPGFGPSNMGMYLNFGGGFGM